MSPIDYADGPRAFPPALPWRWLSQLVSKIEASFQRSRRSDAAIDDNRLRIFFVLAIFALAFATLALEATRTALYTHPGAAGHSAGPPRGARADLVDRNGRILALDLTHYGLYLDPRQVWDGDEIRTKLLQALPKLSADRLERALRAGRREYLAGD